MSARAAVEEGARLWTPSPERVSAANVTRFIAWLHSNRQVSVAGYDELWRWSVHDLEGFWRSIWDYFQIESSTAAHSVVDRRDMSGARWFEGSRVNYAEHVLRHESRAESNEAAFLHVSELRPFAALTWHELAARVRKLATWLRGAGIGPGDVVVSYMPNVPETAIAMLASTAIGAIWSAASPDFGASAVIDRFAQLGPKVLFAADGYRFGGRDVDRRAEVAGIVAELPTLRQVIWLAYLDQGGASPGPGSVTRWEDTLQGPEVSRDVFAFERVDSTHPLWVLFSSGTTGLPKGIVHSHVGMLAEHLKVMHLHMDLRPGHVMFFHTTTGWMMWNLVVASLLTGATAVFYDGSPMHPDPAQLWRLAESAGVTHMGASPTFVQMMEKAGVRPRDQFQLNRLEMLTVSGSPCSPETFGWAYEHVKTDLWVASQSGGTELCSGFVGASPTLPVHAGEIQTRMLGMDVEAWNESGEPVLDGVGELVVKSPFPSMPLRFVNDAGNRRYHEAYFARFPGVWCHGDFLKINSRGGCYVYGRSDSTLNRHGVRIGTAEIYRVVERIEGIADSLVVCCEWPDGSFFMPLFVRLKADHELDATLLRQINDRLRTEASPRHVPDRIESVPSVPYTLSGKKMEVPVRRILMGTAPAEAASRDAMSNPESLDFFSAYAKRFHRRG
jgi:acetoacetyl-CoA synthetase